ncbi:FAD-binding oxidoreductase [Paragemmobacter straminiformis]|uniref:FAD-binding oxidoreductase n=1 Tax=Paragemmobacter straminiformis TaxID=2045119 RepID=A0A842IAL0_9RHOB|nr:FAD-binding oxidoreductase [Gemmobacter straminiformis]MBC2836900.1 FAD-binding oxidoreductase [Gemmobacter straminiformis]
MEDLVGTGTTEGIGPRLLQRGDAGYDAARVVWNGMIDRHPAAILRCGSLADIVAGVRWAAGKGLAVSVKAGGHNVAGHAVGEGALMLDLAGLRGVSVDPVARLAWVEGGALWADVDAATQVHGLAVPGGLISETGVAGLTLSGGVGWLRSRYGLTIDSLVAADVVLASGQVVRAEAGAHDDLFWALRGGGGNFGVVARFCFALHPAGPEVMFCAPVYPASAGAGPIRFWRDFLADKCDDVGSLVEFSTVPEGPDYAQEYWGQRCYTLGAVYAGDAAEGERLLAPLRGLGPLVADFSGIMPYVEVQKLFDPLFPTGAYRCYWKSHLLAELTDAAIDEGLANAIASPSDRSISSFWNFGGATARVAADATAFGDRSFGWMYSLDSVWERADEDATVIGWTRAAWQAFRRHAQPGRVYLNFTGLDEDGPALTRDAFGRNFGRLAAIKRRYDPDNMFRFNQNIRPDA